MIYYHCTWQKVRHIPHNNGMWFPTHDRLKGWEEFGDPEDDSKPWSIRYDKLDFS